MAWYDVLGALGSGVQAGFGAYSWQKELEEQEKNRQSREAIASNKNLVSQILQEMKNAGLLQRTDVQGTTARDVAGIRGETARDVADIGAGSRNYVGELGLAGRRYTADRGLEGRKYGADKAFGASKYRTDVGSSTARRGQDLSRQSVLDRITSDLFQAEQDFNMDEFKTESTNRRSIVGAQDEYGAPSSAAPLSYDKFFESAPDFGKPPMFNGAGPTAPQFESPPANEGGTAAQERLPQLQQQLRALADQARTTANPTAKAALKREYDRLKAEYLALGGR